MFAVVIHNEDTKVKNFLFFLRRGKKIAAKIKILTEPEARKFSLLKTENQFDDPRSIFQGKENVVEIVDYENEEEDI